jgi:hypothetical protein
MKRQVLFLVLVVLCGCADRPESPEGTTTTFLIETTTTSTTTTSSSTTTTVLGFKYPELEGCEGMRADKRDDCYYDVAIDRGDFSLCDEVRSNVIQTLCLAAEKKDKEICKLITDPNTRDKCYYGVALTKVDEGVCDYVGLQILRDNCYLRISREKNRKKICDRIKTPTIKDMCLSECKLRETSSDMIGTVGKKDYVNVTLSAEGCEGLKVSYKADSDYLSLMGQSAYEVSGSYEEISYEFMCLKDGTDLNIDLKIGDEKITKKAACRTFSPAKGCSIRLMDNESVLSSMVTENVHLTIMAENCKDKAVSDYIRPEYLKFVGWSFNGVPRERKYNRTGSDMEKISMLYECTRFYDGVLLRISVGDRELNSYMTCRKKPECSLEFLEGKSRLEADVGEDVHLTVLAEGCKNEVVESAGKLYELSLVNVSTNIVKSNSEEITARYRCEKTSNQSLFIRLSVGVEDEVRYARCMP